MEKPIALPENPTLRLGDLWVLGAHRLICGDSTQLPVVSELLDGTVPFLMVTDPPYGVDYDPSWRRAAGVNKSDRMGKVRNDDRADWKAAWRLFPGNVGYVWHASQRAAEVQASLSAAGLAVRAQVVWAKSRLALSRSNYHWRHEPCYYALRDGGKLTKEQEAEVLREARAAIAGGLEDDHVPCWYAMRAGAGARWVGGRKQSTLWEIASTDDGDKNHHGTQKPIECMARPMRNHDCAEVYDPFVGSGTSLVAAELLGKRCFAVELDPAYVDVAVLRWQAMSGKQATHAETGATFTDVAASRGAQEPQPKRPRKSMAPKGATRGRVHGTTSRGDRRKAAASSET